MGQIWENDGCVFAEAAKYVAWKRNLIHKHTVNTDDEILPYRLNQSRLHQSYLHS